MPNPVTAAWAVSRALSALPLVASACGGAAPPASDPAPASPAAETRNEGSAATDPRATSGVEGVEGALPPPAPRARLELPVTGKPEGVLLRDLDGDGRAELVAVSREPGTLTLWTEPATAWDLAPARRELAIGDYALGPLAFPAVPGVVLVASRSVPSLALVDVLAPDGPTLVARVELDHAPRAITVGTLAGDDAPTVICLDSEGLLHRWDGADERITETGYSAQASAVALSPDGALLVVLDRTAHEARVHTFAGPFLAHERTIALPGIPRDVAFFDPERSEAQRVLVAGGDHALWTLDLDADDALVSTHRTGDIPLRLEVQRDSGGRDVGFVVLPFYRLQVMDYAVAADEPAHATYAGQTPWDVSVGDWSGDGSDEVAIANRDAHRISVLFADEDQTDEDTHAPGETEVEHVTRLSAQEPWRVDRRVPTARGPHAVTGGVFDAARGFEYAVLAALSGELRFHDAATGASRGEALAAGDGADHPHAVDADEDGAAELYWTTAGRRADGSACGVLNRYAGESVERLPEVGASATDLAFVPALRSRLGVQGEWWIADGDAHRVHRLGEDGAPLGEIVFDVAPVALATWGTNDDARVAIACRAPGDQLRVYVYGQNAGLWSEATRLDVHGIPLDLAAADVDGDGATDLCVLAKPRDDDGPGVVLVWRAPFDGGLAQAQETGLRPYAIAAGDLDGDGRDDLVVSAQNSHQLNLWLGRGDTQRPLQRVCDLGAGTGSLGLWIGDADGRRSTGARRGERLQQRPVGDPLRSLNGSSRVQSSSIASEARLPVGGPRRPRAPRDREEAPLDELAALHDLRRARGILDVAVLLEHARAGVVADEDRRVVQHRLQVPEADPVGEAHRFGRDAEPPSVAAHPVADGPPAPGGPRSASSSCRGRSPSRGPRS